MFGKIVNISLVLLTVIGIPLTIFMLGHQQTTTQNASFEYNCDINLDHVVNKSDYNTILACMEPDSPDCRGAKKLAADINNDGVVNEKDLNYFIEKCQALYQHSQ